MKTITLTVALCFVVLISSCPGCQEGKETQKKQGLNEIKKPCVVVAVKKRDTVIDSHNGAIILKGADGIYYTFDDFSKEGSALISSYNKGDTIK